MALAVAVRAGEAKPKAEQAQAPCCAEAKTAAKGECPMAKESCSMAKEEKGCCGAEAKSVAKEQRTKPVLLSPKAAALASK